MSWRLVLPGQPPSINNGYYERVMRTDRQGRSYPGFARSKALVRYQDDAVLLVKSAKPSRWDPPGQVRTALDLYLMKDIDCDNLMKAIHDAIQRGTGINDSRYLPCVRSKTVGVPLRDARVEIEISDL